MEDVGDLSSGHLADVANQFVQKSGHVRPAFLGRGEREFRDLLANVGFEQTIFHHAAFPTRTPPVNKLTVTVPSAETATAVGWMQPPRNTSSAIETPSLVMSRGFA